jgi:hypothetical protein
MDPEMNASKRRLPPFLRLGRRGEVNRDLVSELEERGSSDE